MPSNPASKQSSIFVNDDSASTLSTMPEHIDLEKWGDSGFEWSGSVAPSGFERLTTLLSPENNQSLLQVTVTLYRRHNVLQLAFKLVGDVSLVCQRCLQPVTFDLSDDYNIVLLDDESQVRLVNEEQDYLLLDEIISDERPERLLPLKNIIEDEILLKTPLAPKHDNCEMAVDQVGDIPEEENENPFAALALLKGKL